MIEKNRSTNSNEKSLKPKTVAVIDLGSNSFHLMLARIVDQDVQILLKEKIKVRLASGLDENLYLNQAAIDRGIKTLSIFAHTVSGFHPDDVHIVGTYTLRSAKNTKIFLNKARMVFPYPIEVISGQEEARLIYQGVAHSMHFNENRFVMDIGGGSTEFVIGQGFETKILSSRNVGCVSLQKLFFADNKISKKRFNKALLYVEQHLQPISKEYRQIGWQQAIGTSGTISALTTIAQENGYTEANLTYNVLLAIKDKILSFNTVESIELQGLSQDRQHVILPGLIILLAAFEMLKIDELMYCDKALREGVIYQLEDRNHHYDIRERSVDSLTKRLTVDQDQVSRVNKTCQFLLVSVKNDWYFKRIPETELILKWAAKLYEIGLHINSSGSQRHSAYIVQNCALPGFNQEQQLLLQVILRFHRKKIRVDELPEFSLYSKDEMLKLIALFRISVLLNQKRQDNFLPRWKATAERNKVSLTFPSQWLENKDLFVANLESEQQQLEKINIKLDFSGF